MTTDITPLILLIVILGASVVVPIGLFMFMRRCSRTGIPTSTIKKLLLRGVFGVSLLPFIYLSLFVVSAVADNAPFTSGVIASGVAPTGQQVCVIQTFKGWEPYQVSLYARTPNQPWIWHYLAHQDDRWRSCRVEFTGLELEIYTESKLRKKFALADITTLPKERQEYRWDSLLPADYTPEKILARHNEFFHQ